MSECYSGVSGSYQTRPPDGDKDALTSLMDYKLNPIDAAKWEFDNWWSLAKKIAFKEQFQWG